MKSRKWFVGPLGLLVFAAGCETILGIEDGKLRPDAECTELSDCLADEPACRSVISCTAGKCVHQDAPEGTPLPSEQQTVGDCLDLVCNGNGNTKQNPAPEDKDDANPCTIDTCNGVTPVHAKQSQVMCYSGPAGTNGTGVCKGGIQQCDSEGIPVGSCVGETVPVPYDACEVEYGADDDCDGQVDEDCFCGDGTVQSEFGEECDDGARADGDPCSPTCKEQRVLAIAAGWYHTCAILSGGAVKCWGYNNKGQLGLGDTNARGDQPGEMGKALPTVDLGTGRRALAISSGSYNTCAILDNQTLKCWGTNNSGQLGLGDKDARGDQPAEMGDSLPIVSLGSGALPIAISAGSGHTCALLDNGSVKCWGANGGGQLGYGDIAIRGDEIKEMGDTLPTVNLGSAQTATAIEAGSNITCALLNGGNLKCWGGNGNGSLGLGDTNSRGDNPDEMGDNLPFIQLGTGLTSVGIATKHSHTCALLASKNMKCWGTNYSGTLGLGDTEGRGDIPAEMSDALPLVDLGAMTEVVQVSPGAVHTCALLNGGLVKCWGEGYVLGLGDYMTRGDNQGEMGDALPSVYLGQPAIALALGMEHTCALLQNGSVKCWGETGMGTLGINDSNNRGDEPNEMGDNLPTVKLFSDVW
jgi:cysteine-rich repeat protein